MTQSKDYSDVLVGAAVEAGKRAEALAGAYGLAKILNDDLAAADYLGQVKGINIVLDLINDGLDND